VLGPPVRAPRANAYAERWGTVRRELLDRMLIVGRRQLVLVLAEDADHDNGHRPHRTLGQAPPLGSAEPAVIPPGGRVARQDRLGGLTMSMRRSHDIHRLSGTYRPRVRWRSRPWGPTTAARQPRALLEGPHTEVGPAHAPPATDQPAGKAPVPQMGGFDATTHHCDHARAGHAGAGGPVGTPTISRSGDALTVSGKVAGLGDETQINVALTADVACVNRATTSPRPRTRAPPSLRGASRCRTARPTSA
jgi:hypothetical protein